MIFFNTLPTIGNLVLNSQKMLKDLKNSHKIHLMYMILVEEIWKIELEFQFQKVKVLLSNSLLILQCISRLVYMVLMLFISKLKKKIQIWLPVKKNGKRKTVWDNLQVMNKLVQNLFTEKRKMLIMLLKVKNQVKMINLMKVQIKTKEIKILMLEDKVLLKQAKKIH